MNCWKLLEQDFIRTDHRRCPSCRPSCRQTISVKALLRKYDHEANKIYQNRYLKFNLSNISCHIRRLDTVYTEDN